MDNLKIIARLLNKLLSKKPSTTCRREKRMKAIMSAQGWALVPIPCLMEV